MQRLALPPGLVPIDALLDAVGQRVPDINAMFRAAGPDSGGVHPARVSNREHARSMHLLVLLQLVESGRITPRSLLTRVKLDNFGPSDCAVGSLTFDDAKEFCRELAIELVPGDTPTAETTTAPPEPLAQPVTAPPVEEARAVHVPQEPEGLSTEQLMDAFDLPKMSKVQWANAIGRGAADGPKWLFQHRVSPGKRGNGGHAAKWDPVGVAQTLFDRGKADLETLAKRFKRDDLQPWADRWDRFHRNRSDFGA